MPAAKPKFTPEPGFWNDTQIAARLGKSLTWLEKNRENLYRAGMPRPDPLIGGTDAEAFELWRRRRAGIIDQRGHSSEPDPFAERISGKPQPSVHRLPAE